MPTMLDFGKLLLQPGSSEAMNAPLPPKQSTLFPLHDAFVTVEAHLAHDRQSAGSDCFELRQARVEHLQRLPLQLAARISKYLDQRIIAQLDRAISGDDEADRRQGRTPTRDHCL